MRGSGGVREGFVRCLEMFGRGRERNGLVVREKKGQLGKQRERKKSSF